MRIIEVWVSCKMSYCWYVLLRFFPVSPVVIVRKPDGSNRICIDYRKLNKVTVFDGEPTAKADDIFAKVGKDKYYPTNTTRVFTSLIPVPAG